MEGLDSPFAGFYARVFGPIRNRVRNVLVVGCGDGRMCPVFADYFPYARVVGADIDISQVSVDVSHPRVDFAGMDATLPGFLRMLPGGPKTYDIIIEDVRHARSDICRFALPHVADKGMYIVEYMNVGNVAIPDGYAVQVYDYLPLHQNTIAVIQRAPAS